MKYRAYCGLLEYSITVEDAANEEDAIERAKSEALRDIENASWWVRPETTGDSDGM